MYVGSSPRYLVLWKVQLLAPNSLLTQWVSVRAPSESEAVAEMERVRPDWTILKVRREQNP